MSKSAICNIYIDIKIHECTILEMYCYTMMDIFLDSWVISHKQICFWRWKKCKPAHPRTERSLTKAFTHRHEEIWTRVTWVYVILWFLWVFMTWHSFSVYSLNMIITQFKSMSVCLKGDCMIVVPFSLHNSKKNKKKKEN